MDPVTVLIFVYNKKGRGKEAKKSSRKNKNVYLVKERMIKLYWEDRYEGTYNS